MCLPTSVVTFVYLKASGFAQLFIAYMFSFSRPGFRNFFGHEEYLLYRNKERNFEVGTNTIPNLFNAPHFYLILINLRLSSEGRLARIDVQWWALFVRRLGENYFLRLERSTDEFDKRVQATKKKEILEICCFVSWDCIGLLVVGKEFVCSLQFAFQFCLFSTKLN